MTEQVKCEWCGKFISYADMGSGAASFHFEPDSHKGPEISEWTCASCETADHQSAGEASEAVSNADGPQ